MYEQRCMYVYVHTYLHMYVCMYVCMYVQVAVAWCWQWATGSYLKSLHIWYIWTHTDKYYIHIWYVCTYNMEWHTFLTFSPSLTNLVGRKRVPSCGWMDRPCGDTNVRLLNCKWGLQGGGRCVCKKSEQATDGTAVRTHTYVHMCVLYVATKAMVLVHKCTHCTYVRMHSCTHAHLYRPIYVRMYVHKQAHKLT